MTPYFVLSVFLHKIVKCESLHEVEVKVVFILIISCFLFARSWQLWRLIPAKFQHSSFCFKRYVYDWNMVFLEQNPFFAFKIIPCCNQSKFKVAPKDSRLKYCCQQSTIHFNSQVSASTAKPSLQRSSLLRTSGLPLNTKFFASTLSLCSQRG